MIKHIFPFIIYSLLVISCSNNGPNTTINLLLGDWKELTQADSANYSFGVPIPEGYLFLQNGICENKQGYFKNVTAKISGMEKATGVGTEKTKQYYLGTKTKYKIEKDFLKIYDLADGLWKASKIVVITPDTLILQGSDKKITRFIKTYYSIDENSLFDEIVVSSSGCYGTCPINNIFISKTGKAIFYGEEYNHKNGLYFATITDDQFSSIELNLKKAGVDKINDTYEANWTDDETISMTFIRKGEIIKSITDYGHVAPTELYWAYTQIRNIYQLLNLDTLNSIPAPLNQGDEVLFPFILSKSENFYLKTLLWQAKETNIVFAKKYELSFNGFNKINRLETDGRFYAFTMLDESKKTFDIGFNFIERNSLADKLKNNDLIKVYN